MGFVVADLGCQPECIWRELKPEQLGTPVRTFLNYVI